MKILEIRLIFVTLLLFMLIKNNSGDYAPAIEIPQGTVRGVSSGSLRKYLGIPYASVVERFQEALDPPTWDDTFDATNGNIQCNQYSKSLSKAVGQEDCLVVNVHTPDNIEQDSLLPVMAFIHGGGYYKGSGYEYMYDPEFIVKHNVIVVTINYRLGAFGFLCLKVEGAPGNVGLKDQVAALRWIKNNIIYFGGDPNSVTLVGESAGASSVNYLLFSPLARGLFHAAIVESGAVISPFAFKLYPEESGFFVASQLGYNGTDLQEVLEVLKNAEADDIINATPQNETNSILGPYIFRPCIEKQLPGLHHMITKAPEDIIETNKVNKVPMIIGINNKEGMYYAGRFNEDGVKKLNENFDDAVPDNLFFCNETEKKSVYDEIKKIYFKEGISRDTLIDYFSDVFFYYPTVIVLKRLLKTKSPMYNYYFQYSSQRNLIKAEVGFENTTGACHADELGYLFNPLQLKSLPMKRSDKTIINRMTTLWTNFMKYHEPSTPVITWDPSIENDIRFLSIDNQVKMMSSVLDPKRIDFWRKVYNNYRAKNYE